jgi:hypothetical protein
MQSIGGKGRGAPASMLTELRRKRTLFRSYDPSNAKNFQSVSPLDIIQFQSTLNAYSDAAKSLLTIPAVINYLFTFANLDRVPRMDVFRITSASSSSFDLYTGSAPLTTLVNYSPTPPFNFLTDALNSAFSQAGRYSLGVGTDLGAFTGLTFRTGRTGNEITLPVLSNLQTLYLDRLNRIRNTDFKGFTSLEDFTVTDSGGCDSNVDLRGLSSLSNILLSTPDVQTLHINSCPALESLDLEGCTDLTSVIVYGNYSNLAYINTTGVDSQVQRNLFTAISNQLPTSGSYTWDTNEETGTLPDGWSWNVITSNQYSFASGPATITTASVATAQNYAIYLLGAGADGTSSNGGGAGGFFQSYGPISDLTFPLTVRVGIAGGSSNTSITDQSNNVYFATGGSGTQGGTYGSNLGLGGPVAPSHFSHDGSSATGSVGGLADNLSGGGVYGSGGNAETSGQNGYAVIRFF